MLTNDEILDKLYREQPFLENSQNEKIDRYFQIVFYLKNGHKIIFNKPLIRLSTSYSQNYRYVNAYGEIFTIDEKECVGKIYKLRDFEYEKK